MTVEWKDRTSYERGERGTKEPTIWEAEISTLRVTVHRYHGLEGWFGTCHGVEVQQRQLDSSDLEGAKIEFVQYLAKRCAIWSQALERAAPELCAACDKPKYLHNYRHPFKAKQ